MKLSGTTRSNYVRDKRSPSPKSETVSRVMSSIKGKNTKPELLFRKALRAHGLRGYRLHWKKVSGRPDISFPGKKIAIFVNGCYWHRCPNCDLPLPKHNRGFWMEKFKRNTQRDKIKTEELESANWYVLTFWECDIKNIPDECVAQVQKAYDHN